MNRVSRALGVLRDAWSLTKPYFSSDDRRAGLALLIVLIGLNLGIVYVNVIFTEWNNLFYTALQHKDWPEFWHQLLRFCWIAAAFIIVAIIQIYLNRVLQIRWRQWLTGRYLDAWLDRQAYYRMQLVNGGQTDNPDQRIADDLRLFCGQTLTLSLGLLRAVVTLVSFLGMLWVLSGSADLVLFGHPVSIPGYMVWFALVYSVAGSFLTNLVGRRLIPLNFDQQRFEADFRFDLVRVRENADAIALDRGEASEKKVLLARFAAVARNWLAIMRAQINLTLFTAGYSQIAIVFPFIVASPRYFSGAIELGGLMQTASAFGQVQEALSFIVNAYADIAEWSAVIRRLTQFRIVTEAENRSDRPVGIRVERGRDPAVTFDALALALPSDAPLLAADQIRLEPGTAVLVTGPSGSGKSTLFRAIAGIWPYGSGKVRLPEGARLMFVPQRPYLPIGTLRDALTYPKAQAAVDDARLREILRDCKLPDLAGRLDETRHWALSLSPGEQQRLAIARVLLQAPDWLFVDEATSALDEETERALYALLAERLPRMTIVSIGHRSSLRAYHRGHLAIERPAGTARGRLLLAPMAPALANNLPA